MTSALLANNINNKKRPRQRCLYCFDAYAKRTHRRSVANEEAVMLMHSCALNAKAPPLIRGRGGDRRTLNPKALELGRMGWELHATRARERCCAEVSHQAQHPRANNKNPKP